MRLNNLRMLTRVAHAPGSARSTLHGTAYLIGTILDRSRIPWTALQRAGRHAHHFALRMRADKIGSAQRTILSEGVGSVRPKSPFAIDKRDR